MTSGFNWGWHFNYRTIILILLEIKLLLEKKIGGDILEDKKTILYHLALKGEADHVNELQSLLGGNKPLNEQEKINKVKLLFEATSAKSATRDLIHHHSQLSNIELEKLSIDKDQKSRFRELKNWLMHRTY